VVWEVVKFRAGCETQPGSWQVLLLQCVCSVLEARVDRPRPLPRLSRLMINVVGFSAAVCGENVICRTVRSKLIVAVRDRVHRRQSVIVCTDSSQWSFAQQSVIAWTNGYTTRTEVFASATNRGPEQTKQADRAVGTGAGQEGRDNQVSDERAGQVPAGGVPADPTGHTGTTHEAAGHLSRATWWWSWTYRSEDQQIAQVSSPHTIVAFILLSYCLNFLHLPPFGAAAQRGPWPPHSWGSQITHNDAPQMVGLL